MYVPRSEDIPNTKENYLGVFTDKQLYDPGWSTKQNEVYGPRDAMTANTINFTRVKQLDEDPLESIVSIKSGLILDGGMRIRYSDGDRDYGTRIYARNGKKNTHDRLIKYTDGKCYYDEQIKENGEWKYTLRFRFNESTLTWTSLNKGF